MQMPSAPDITVVISVAKLSIWCGLCYGVYRIFRELHKIYRAIWIFLVEYRMIAADFWERRPDKREEFHIVIGKEDPKSMAAKAG